MKQLAAIFALALAFVATNVSATGDAANGAKIYNGAPSASFPAGTRACASCHNVDNPGDIIRAGASAQNIAFAIASFSAMNVLFSSSGQFPLSASDISDVSAFINSVVNPGPPTLPAFAAAPPAADFGAVSVGMQSAPTTFTIGDTVAAGTITSVVSSNNGEFLLAGGTCIAAPHDVALNGSCSISVIFAPMLAGARTGDVLVFNTGTPNPLRISLSGAGAASAPAQGNLAMPPPANLGVQAVLVQGTARALTVQNIGAAAANIVSVTSDHAAEFTVTSTTCNGALGAGASCVINVAFRPLSMGARSATLSIVSDGIGSPQSIALSGTGAGMTGSAGSPVTVVEFYNAAFDHYFVTPVIAEIGLLGQPPFQDWQPTGLSFAAYSAAGAPPGSVGICRFFNDHFAPKSTHFYAPHGLGCEATLAGFPDWTLEDPQLFFAQLPDAAGNCPAQTIPLYRLYNNGQGGAPNHRFTTRLDVRQAMLDKGYLPEGNGIGVGMCVPNVATGAAMMPMSMPQ